MNDEKDLCIKLLKLPILRFFLSIYKKYKEIILYVFFGGLAFVVSIVTYALFNKGLGINVLVANFFSWVITVLFAFFTNRIWVFQAHTGSTKDFLQQILSFFSGRILTLLIEEAILVVFVSFLCFPNMAVKITAQIVVIILNYVISKIFVFKKRKAD